jgi:hypothetical protein
MDECDKGEQMNPME